MTSPWITNPTCASDKLAWIERHAGSGWAKRTIITNDKTLIIGDYLIDDKPKITGSLTPLWRHVLFHGPYNVSVRPHPIELASWAPEDLDPFLERITGSRHDGPASLRSRR